jgi:hypothetical protein
LENGKADLGVFREEKPTVVRLNEVSVTDEYSRRSEYTDHIEKLMAVPGE